METGHFCSAWRTLLAGEAIANHYLQYDFKQHGLENKFVTYLQTYFMLKTDPTLTQPQPHRTPDCQVPQLQAYNSQKNKCI